MSLHRGIARTRLALTAGFVALAAVPVGIGVALHDGGVGAAEPTSRTTIYTSHVVESISPGQ